MIYTKEVEHIFSGFSMSIILTIRDIENKNHVYGAKDCMKKLLESLREHTMEIIIFLERWSY